MGCELDWTGGLPAGALRKQDCWAVRLERDLGRGQLPGLLWFGGSCILSVMIFVILLGFLVGLGSFVWIWPIVES